MSNRLARTIVVLWVLAFAATATLGFSWGMVGMWRLHVSSTEPTASNSATFRDRGRTYFAPPDVVDWHRRFGSLFPPALACFVAYTIAATVVVSRHDAVGRPWRSSKERRP